MNAQLKNGTEVTKQEVAGVAVVMRTGYGNTSLEAFLARLEAYGITLLVDLRSKPSSRLPHFRKVNLSNALTDRGIKYRWMGNLLGGMGCTEAMWLRGLQTVAELAKTENVVIMCCETDPRKCHRTQLGDLIASELKLNTYEM